MTRFLTIFLSLLLCLGIGLQLQAQVVPVHSQYLINPYIYNPARLAEEGYTQVNVGFRKQWWGVEGSPTVGSATLELPLNENLAIGGRLVNYTEGPINQTQLHFSASYRLTLDYYEEQFLSFGMSLGMRNNMFNTSALDDPDDPALAQIAGNSLNIDGAFGLAYHYKTLQIGISAPHLSNPQYFSEQGFGPVEIRPWEQMIFTAGYGFFIDYYQNWELKPQVLYHYDTNFDNQIEGMLTASYQGQYWGGLSYRQQYGVSIMAGANINETFALNYSYGVSSPEAQVPNDSHELTLRIRLGGGEKKRSAPWDEVEYEEDDNDKESIKDEEVEDKEVIKEKPTEKEPETTPSAETETNPLLKVDESISLDGYDENLELRFKIVQGEVYARSSNGSRESVEAGNRLIVSEYKYMSRADEDIRAYRAKGLSTELIYVEETQRYYLSIVNKSDLEQARKLLVSIRRLNGFKETRLLILE